MNTYQILTIIFPTLILISGGIKGYYDLRRRITVLEVEFRDYVTKEIDKYGETVRIEVRKETALLLSEKQHRDDYEKLNNKIDDLHDLIINKLFDK